MKITSKEYQKSIEKNLKDMSYELENITQGKKSRELSIRFYQAEERNQQNEDRTIEIIQPRKQKEKKRMRKMSRGLKTGETPSSVPIYAYTFCRNPRTQEKERVRKNT